MIGVSTHLQSYGPYRNSQPLLPTQNAWSTASNQTLSLPRTIQLQPQQSRSSIHAPRTSSSRTMEPNPRDDMETFQRLSDQYQPEVQGPLVGEKLPMDVLAREYAQADPRFITKTESLARTHSAYRPIKGDGQCGWRAAVFGYFEVLLQSGDLRRIAQEKTRLRGFDTTMRAAEIDVDILSDMFDCTYELFDRMHLAIEGGDKTENAVMQTMNNEGDSSCILYHFKSMTSAYMQLSAEHYEPFLEIPMLQYRQSRIDPSNQEIDQIGLQALIDGVISPAGIALDVSYLDRSTGNEVTPHCFVPNATGWPKIRLLYRPGHYDMLYQESQQVQSQLVQVNLLSQVDDDSDPYYQPYQVNMDLHTMLSPNESVWEGSMPSGPYQPLQQHQASTPMSYNNVYQDQYSYSPAVSLGSVEPAMYAQSWSAPLTTNTTPVTASPISPMTTLSPMEESNNEPRIRPNNWSLLARNHHFPSYERGPPPGSPAAKNHVDAADFEIEQYRPENCAKKQPLRQKKASP